MEIKANGIRGRPLAARGRPGWWAWTRLVLLGIALAVVTGFTMIFPRLSGEGVVLEEGDVAPQDIQAPRRMAYESAILRAQEQERVVAAVEPVYTPPDPAFARQQLGRANQVLDYLENVRADTLASFAQRQAYVRAVPELTDFPSASLDALLSLSEASWERVRTETLAAVDRAMRQEIREGHLEEVRERIPALISLDLTNEEAAVTAALAQRLVVPNAFLDAEATSQAQVRARDSVAPVLLTFEAGQIIVREGERVTALQIEALDQFGLRQSSLRWNDFLSVGLFAALGTVWVFLYLARFQPEVVWDGPSVLLLTLLLAVFVIGSGLMVPAGVVLRYLSPSSALAMLAATVLGAQAGVAGALFLGGVVGVIAGNSLELAAYTALSGLIAALSLRRVERIGALFRAGALAAVAHVVVLAAFRLPYEASSPAPLLVAAGAGLVNGGIAASLALGGLFLIGPLFDIPTTMRLIELSRPNQPLLQRLLREAPATYHHSLMVANLAEQAAERIGADPLLTRVGAYYHDIGKLVRPYFFSENQVEGVNPHDRLDPRTSAEVIISHVTDGLEMARRHHLPGRVRAFIPEHHGTHWVSFLYDKAVKQAGGAALVNADDFRYQGPKPQSKETALVMLADGCEAVVRAMRPTSAEEVAEIVNSAIAERVTDGQLNDCDLTLRDLEVTRAVFISALKGLFHPRIQYPKEGIANAR